MQTLFKLAAAVVVAAVLVVVINVYGAAVYSAGAPADIPPEARPKAASAAKAGGAQVAAAPVELKPGDAEAGKKLLKQCTSCHTVEQGGANKVGPNLWAVAGGRMAAKDGFKYSAGLAGKGGTWDDETLNAWLTSPKAVVSDTKMAFAGIKDAQQRLDLIAYLHTLK